MPVTTYAASPNRQMRLFKIATSIELALNPGLKTADAYQKVTQGINSKISLFSPGYLQALKESNISPLSMEIATSNNSESLDSIIRAATALFSLEFTTREVFDMLKNKDDMGLIQIHKQSQQMLQAFEVIRAYIDSDTFNEQELLKFIDDKNSGNFNYNLCDTNFTIYPELFSLSSKVKFKIAARTISLEHDYENGKIALHGKKHGEFLLERHLAAQVIQKLHQNGMLSLPCDIFCKEKEKIINQLYPLPNIAQIAAEQIFSDEEDMNTQPLQSKIFSELFEQDSQSITLKVINEVEAQKLRNESIEEEDFAYGIQMIDQEIKALKNRILAPRNFPMRRLLSTSHFPDLNIPNSIPQAASLPANNTAYDISVIGLSVVGLFSVVYFGAKYVRNTLNYFNDKNPDEPNYSLKK